MRLLLPSDTTRVSAASSSARRGETSLGNGALRSRRLGLFNSTGGNGRSANGIHISSNGVSREGGEARKHYYSAFVAGAVDFPVGTVAAGSAEMSWAIVLKRLSDVGAAS